MPPPRLQTLGANSVLRIVWQLVLPAGLVIALALAFFELRIVRPIPLPQDVGRRNGDLYAIYFPLYSFTYGGEKFLPAWNPYQLAGTPSLGLYAGGVLYPPNMLAGIVPVHRALGYLVALHLALAGLGTLLLGRSLGLSPPAGMLAAVTFMLNFLLVNEHLRPMYLNGLAWIPVVSLLAGRLVVAPSVSRAIGLGVAVALQFLTGHAQIVCYEAYVLLLVAGPVYVLWGRRWQLAYLVRLGLMAALAASVAALVAAVQLLPLVEVLSQAVRGAAGLTIEQTMSQQPTWTFTRVVLASSGLAVLLVPFALFPRAAPRPLVAVCVAVAVFTGAIGIGTVLYSRFFFFLPGVALFRLPHEILLIGALALSVLAGVGLDALRARPSWSTLAVGMLASILIAVALRPEFSSLAAVVACLVAMMLIGRSPRGRWGSAFAWALVLIVGSQQFARSSNTIMIPAANDAAFFEEPPFVRVLRDLGGHERTLVIKDWKRRFPIMEKSGSLWRLPVVQDYEALTPAIYREFLRPLEGMNTDAPLFWGRFTAPPFDAGWRPLDLMSTRFVVVAPGVAHWVPRLGGRFREVYRGADAIIYENTRALPRAYLVSAQRVLPHSPVALATLMSPLVDARSEVVVEEPIELPSGPDRPDVPAEATITEASPERVALTVSTPQPALLVLTDLLWPGWRATVDGEERQVHRANYLFRAVALEPGRHTVMFTYRPVSVRVGAALTAVTVLSLAAWLVVRRRRGTRAAFRAAPDGGSPQQ